MKFFDLFEVFSFKVMTSMRGVSHWKIIIRYNFLEWHPHVIQLLEGRI